MFASLREKLLCCGAEECENASEVCCVRCGHVWAAADVFNPGRCPACGQGGFEVRRCAVCPLDDLDYARAYSGAGAQLGRLIDLEFAVEKLGVRWDEISARDVRGLRVLKEERDRFSTEKQKGPEPTGR